MLGPRSRSTKSAFSTDGAMSRQVINDTVVDWKKLKAEGTLVCNPADSYKESWAAKTFFGFKGKFTRPGYPTSYKVVGGNQAGTWRPDSYLWSIDAHNSALVAWKNSCKKVLLSPSELAVHHTAISANLAEGIASLIVTFAELDKTKSMLLKALGYLRRPLRDVLRIGRRMTARERVNKLNEWWLEGRYGWRPFIYDVGNIIDAGNKSVSDRRTVKYNIGAGELMSPGNFVTDYSWNGLKSTVRRDSSLVAWYNVGQTADYRMSLLSNFRKFGWFDVVGAAWDLVPYSFVVDWFINVGDAAKALQAYALIDERIGWTKYTVSVKSVLVHSVVNAGPSPSGYGTVVMEETYNVGTFPHYSEVKWDRDPVTNFMPTVGLRFDLDWAQVVDSAALLLNLWNKVRRN